MKKKCKRKFFVFSDVHAEYDKLTLALRQAKYDCDNENHWIVSLGDNFDRGSQSAEVLDFLINTPRVFALIGNHEMFLIDFMENNNSDLHNTNYYYNGMRETIMSLTQTTLEECDALFTHDPEILRTNIMSRHPKLTSLLYSMELTIETKTHILVHASLGEKGDLDNLEVEDALWDIDTIHYDYSHLDRTVVFGHMHAWRNRVLIEETHSFDHSTFIHKNKVSIDGCTNHEAGVVNIYTFEEGFDAE